MTYENFCDELKAKSSAIHEKSDRLVQLKLAVVLTDTKLYSKVLGDFFCIFKAIEDGVQNNIDHKYLTDLWIPALLRADKFVQDLEYYNGLGWRDMLKPSAAALKYVSRIETLANEEPALLVAYVHTMYLAIFSGGFILRRLIKNTLGIPGPDGLNIFDIAEGQTRFKVKNHIKDTINGMDFDRELKDRIIQEKISIFQRNNELVAAVQPSLSSYKRIMKLVIVFLFAILFAVLLIRTWF